MNKEDWIKDFYKLDPLNISTEMVKIESMKWSYFEGRKSAKEEIDKLRKALKDITNCDQDNGLSMLLIAEGALEKNNE
jgi:hypothetical protein